MTKLVITVGLCILVLAGLVVVIGRPILDRQEDADAGSESMAVTATAATVANLEGFLYGRVTTIEGTIYEGRLRLGGDEEALWNHFFNGFKAKNPWAQYVPPERLPSDRRSISVFGIRMAERTRPLDLRRPFMTRFGDLARIDAGVRELRVTLKSGTVLELDRLAADDFADGLRIWDQTHGVVDLGEARMRRMTLFPGTGRDAVAAPLYGTVNTREGHFTGLIQWNREQCLGSDTLHGQTADGEISLRFDTIRSIVRGNRHELLIVLRDARQVTLAVRRDAPPGQRGISIDDPRYGRVSVSWEAFERVEFDASGIGPTYGDFPPGSPISGTVTTRSGRRLTGRLVYDLDEHETTETLDASWGGVDFTIPFSKITRIVPAPGHPSDPAIASVTLQGGETRPLEAVGDLGPENAGVLVFVEGRQDPEYVTWNDVAHIDLDPPAVRVAPHTTIGRHL